MVDIAESLKDYTWEERYEWIHQKRLKGNRLFAKSKYDEAIKAYMDALMGLDLQCKPPVTCVLLPPENFRKKIE